MPSYVVTGASRGIGFEFLRQLSADPASVVVGLVRDKAGTEKKVAAEIGRSNIHILKGDLTNYESLKTAAEETSKITGGSLDYLIANGAVVSALSANRTFTYLGEDPEALEEDLLDSFKTNVIGNIHLINLFLPLIKKGQVKKVVVISSGMGDFDLNHKYDLDMAGPYSLSKAAMNLAIVKYNGELREEGILFMSISPGLVETSGHNDASKMNERELKNLEKMGRKFAEYAPHLKGPITPEESVKMVTNVFNNATAEKDGGSFVSQFGNKQWL
ncbi:NAD(P)-binding protein [Hypoxylon crocopeplum]|nr:NAD(P)-binding protein [Hypoxylon crocopeplum]